ncbi:MAG TPA: adenylate kinase [Acidimicrobiales bacterium]|nr:adenylate kinase [Acidimicrobiales bacterium]
MRISVVGSAGSGKTTLARQVAQRVGIRHVELDSLFHLEGWTPNPEFRPQVEAALATPAWVCDGNYSAVADLVRGRADTIVVLDLPRWRVMTQIVSRTLGRSLLRRELWNGNREGLGNFLRWDPEQNIIRWAWTRYHPVRRRYLAARENGDWDHAEVVWLRSHREAGRWLDSLQPPEPPGPGGE